MDTQPVDFTPALSREELTELKAFEQRVENRTHLIKTKTEYVRKPVLLMKHMIKADYQALLKRKFNYTDSDEETDREEVSDLMNEYWEYRKQYSETDIEIADKYYKQQDLEKKIEMENKEREEKENKQLESLKRQKEPTYTLVPRPWIPGTPLLCSKVCAKGVETEIPGPSNKKFCSDYDLGTVTDDNVNKLEEYDEERHKIETKLQRYTTSVWSITPVWRLYTFRFPRYVIPISHPKLWTTFERDGNCTYMDALPIGDTTKLEPRIWTRRVQRFGITPGWKYCLNDKARCEAHEVKAGDGMEKFLESTSRRQHDKWTPRYQSLTVMVENVESKDVPEQYPYIIYCLVGRASVGRDIDSKSYLLVRPRYFDKNVSIENQRYDENGLHEWLIKMGKEENGRIYCGSTDFRITTCVKQIQETLEQKTV